MPISLEVIYSRVLKRRSPLNKRSLLLKNFELIVLKFKFFMQFCFGFFWDPCHPAFGMNIILMKSAGVPEVSVNPLAPFPNSLNFPQKYFNFSRPTSKHPGDPNLSHNSWLKIFEFPVIYNFDFFQQFFSGWAQNIRVTPPSATTAVSILNTYLNFPPQFIF